MRDLNDQMKFEHDEHQQWLIANPMSQAEYDRRKELWDSFFKKEEVKNERL